MARPVPVTFPRMAFQVLLVTVLAGLSSALPAQGGQLTLDALYGDQSLSGPRPKGLQVSPDGARVSFLRSRPEDHERFDLWEYNLTSGATRMLVDSQALVAEEHLSDAELARRERERTAGQSGILEYSWSPDGRELLFPLGGSLYAYDLQAPPGRAVRKLATGPGAIIDPRISPRGRYVSYVRDQNLYVIDRRTGRERALTRDGRGTVHNGEAEFIAQEEMDRNEGYWWAPDDSAIAFERYDEAGVEVARRFEVYADHTEVVEQRYPRAGSPNVRVQLGVLSPQGGKPRWLPLGDDADIYLARVDWLPDARALSYQRLARDQRRLDLVRVDLASLRATTLLTEASASWVNLHGDLHFLANQPAFIWSSERSGFRHLYLYGLDGRLQHELTSGDWPVAALEAVDEVNGRAWFTGAVQRPTSRQLYSVALDGSEAASPRLASDGLGWHAVRFPQPAQGAPPRPLAFYLDVASDPSAPRRASVRGIDGSLRAWIEPNALDERHPYWPYRDQHVLPEFGTLQAEDGQALHYSLFKPPGFDPARRYPVLVNVYGGPGVQVVTEEWPDLFDEYLAQQGYVVFALDNRGAEGYGRRFTDGIQGQLGRLEVADQAVGARWLAAQPWVDAAHIGVFGWSYGGYMVLKMLAHDPQLYAAGVSVAPVTDWAIYDTCYTERYLGKPQDDAGGYRKSAVFDQLGALRSHLLLVHGMADDNVLFLNSTRLMAALQAQGTPFDLMTYPGGKHGLSQKASTAHVRHTIAAFLARELHPGP